MANRITTVIDFATDRASTNLKKFRTDVQSADGAVGKMKAGFGGASDFIKQNAAGFAVSAGTAIAAFGAKAVADFQEAALAAGQFADATGLSTEQASKWISVADDMGLNADTVQKSFLRLNKELGEGSATAEQYGVSIQRAANGQVDMNATMLLAIDRIGKIQDPTRRAAAAQELFGRSYAEVAEIVLGDSKKINAALESTSEQQIFDEDEVEKARRLRASLDNLNDVMTDLSMAVGESLVPALADAADYAAKTARYLQDLDGGMEDATKGAFNLGDTFKVVFTRNPAAPILDKITKAAEDAASGMEYLDNATMTVDRSSGRASKSTKELADSLDDADDAASDVVQTNYTLAQATIDQYIATAEARREHDLAARAAERRAAAEEALYESVHKNITGLFEYEDATIELINSAEDHAAAIAEVEKAQKDGTLKGDQYARALRDIRLEENDLARQAFDTAAAYAKNQGAIEGSTDFMRLQRDELVRLADQFPQLRDEIQLYIDELNRIPATISTAVQISRSNNGGSVTVADTSRRTFARQGVQVHGAAGGIVTQPTQALIGEAGPEMVIPLDRSPGASPLPNMVGGGATNITVNVTAPDTANPDQFGRKVAQAIQREIRFRGPISGWT